MAKMEPTPVDIELVAGTVTMSPNGTVKLTWLYPEPSIDPNMDTAPQQRIELELGKASITDLTPVID